MKTIINFTTESGQTVQVTVRAIFNGIVNDWAGKGSRNNEYLVTIKTDLGRASFKYKTSQADYAAGKQDLTHADLQNALYCFLSDACAGDDTFENFCSEMGYDTDSRSAEKMHKECVKQGVKAKKVFEDIYEAANAVSELENA